MAIGQVTIDDFHVWQVAHPLTLTVRRIERESRLSAARSTVPCLRMAYEQLAYRCSNYNPNLPANEAKMAVEILAAGQDYLRYFDSHPIYVNIRDKEAKTDGGED